MSSYPLKIEVYADDGTQTTVNCNETGDFDSAEYSEKKIQRENIVRVVFPDGLRGTGNLCKECKNLVHVKLPEGLETISYQAFSDCSKLGSIEIPASVKLIDEEAFAGCKLLKDVFLPKNVELGDSVFSECTRFVDFYIPPGVKTIPNYAFAGCTGLKYITFYPGTGLTKIGTGAFQGCKLKRVDIPEGVTEVGDEAFSRCEKLEAIIFPSTMKDYGTGIVWHPSSRRALIVFPLIFLAKDENDEPQDIQLKYFDWGYFNEYPDRVEEKIKDIEHDHRSITEVWELYPEYDVTAWDTDEGEKADEDGERSPKRARTSGKLYNWTDGGSAPPTLEPREGV